MRCRHCGNRYPADIAQPAPGGSSPPGHFFYAALAFASVAGIGWLTGLRVLVFAGLAIAAVTALIIPLAWHDCHGPAGGSPTGGETCPRCGRRNRVWPWST